ncbi:MAG: hypothetical protein NTY75_02510, partial [Candidatus Shapirobacteria bacterium]|nr:hypothetical protein [Candidatus Shapirobacteria bacterium]
PIDLLINLSEKVVKMDADSEEVVAHILAKGILIEEGCKTMYREITQKIEERAPTLWASYQKMLVDEKWLGQIIRPEDLK